MMFRPLISGVLAFSIAATAFAQTSDVSPTPVEGAEEAALPPADPAAVKPDSSYGLGYRTGQTFREEYSRFGIAESDIQMEAFIKGFTAALKGLDAEIPEEKIQAAMVALGEQLQEREKNLAAENLEKGARFLEENAKREGVTTTQSGLQYEVLTPGGDVKYQSGPDGKEVPKTFEVKYRGTTIDGKEFDKSPEQETVSMNFQVIDGIKEALTTMPVGAKWKLFIPSPLAYGDQRRNADIAPNQVLIFDLELVEIKDAPSSPHGGLEGFPFLPPQGE